MTKQAKRLSVNAFSHDMTSIDYFFDGRPFSSYSTKDCSEPSPIHFLLVAVAGCFVFNCRAVIVKRRLKGIDLEVVVTGEHVAANDRLANIVVAAIFRGNISDTDAAIVVEKTKPLCTVTNTVLTSPDISYETRDLGFARPRRSLTGTDLLRPFQGG